jgi:hypothetical protein
MPEIIGDTLLRLPDGTEFDPQLHALRYHGTLQTIDGTPLLIFSGIECQDCDANRTVHLRSPDPRLFSPETEFSAIYAFPGKQFSYEDDSVLVESRLFYGICLEREPNPVVVQFATHYEDSTAVERVVYSAVRDDRIADSILTDSLPKLPRTLRRVQNGKCRELQPEDMYAPP